MPRRPRAEYDIGVYHVYARGNRKQTIYVDDADRRRYLSMLGRVTTRMDWICLAYCLMGNHVHLLIETRTPNLGMGMHRLHGGYAQYINRRYRQVGHLYQDRFEAVPVESDPQLWTVAAYIARNPVTARLCDVATEWPWSSHTAMLTGRTPLWLDASRLLAYFGAQGGNGLRRYEDLVNLLSRHLPKGDSPL